MAGRPSKLSDAVQRRVVEALAEGATRTEAAEAGGVHRATLMRWLALGQAPDATPRLRKFAAAVVEAEGTPERVAERAILRSIQQGSWRAAFAFLERRHPGKWSKLPPDAALDAARAATNGEGKWELGDLAKLDDDQLEQLAGLLERTH